ncbi:MAG: radical SAM family heme chaperone HemW [Crocosphaera sp.]|nr:radical SAM family heme chaperone HemW [Crocosphaera sp.]
MKRPLPESVYVHIPFCRRRCYYCDFPISVLGDKLDTNKSGSVNQYVDFLCQEIKLTPSYGVPLKTVFFGGGTPSLLPIKSLEKVLKSLEQKFDFSNNVEISLEVDPGTFTLEKLSDYQKIGVNRLSLGVQSFDDILLEKCGRFHRIKEIEKAINYLEKVEFDNFSLDLISGLPYQSLEQWTYSLEKAVEINPKHISCYDLVLEPVTAFGKQYKPGQFPLPSDNQTAKMYKMAQEILTKAGYEHYEISNYAKPNYQCLHNLVYWENKPYYGLGMGAASYTNNQRFTRPKTRKDYYAWIQNIERAGYYIDSPQLTKIDILLETLMLGMRLKKGIKLSELYRQFSTENIETIYQVLLPYFSKKLVVFKDQYYQPITEQPKLENIDTINLSDPDGFLVSNMILSSLFKVLDTI